MSCSSDDQSDKECPLCMEQLEIDDVDFYPCKCEYQICRFCWHRLLTDENGLCPACRQPYPEDPVNFKPLSSADVQRIKDEKRLKQQAEKLRISESRKHLANYRVLQKKSEYFGRYGKILKVVVGTAPNVNHPHLQPSHTAYVTYSKVEEALRAIQGVGNAQLDGRIVKASLGTTKYCSSFLRSQKCFKPECMYLHEIAESDISFTKDDMHMGKHAEYERRLIDMVLNKSISHSQDKRTQLVIFCKFGIRSASFLAIDSTTYRAWVNKNVCWEQNGREISEEPLDNVAVDIAYSNNDESSLEDPTPSEALSLERDRQISHGKENQPKRVLSKPPTLCQRESTPPPKDPTLPMDYLTTVRDVVEEEAEVIQQMVSPSSDFKHGNDSKLFRFMLATEDSGQGVVPAPAPTVEAPAPLINWQALLGLAPQATGQSSQTKAQSSRQVVTSPPPGLNGFGSDDDLGFDPFSESSKGLAVLLEEEKTKYQHSVPLHNNHHQGLHSQGHSLRDLWIRPLAGFTGQLPSHPQHNSFDLFPGLSSLGSNGHASSIHHQQHQTHFDFPPAFAPPPGLIPPQHRPSQPAPPQSMSEWQEGLKALLPNVNVRFASDLENHSHQSQHTSRWPQTTSFGIDSVGRASSSHHMMPHSIPPPPGFSVPNR
uniref:RING-type domain-containing protein n=1 Tax=Heterorhabditis bacteriophora TaxID=37862 RepID=A0A1I7XD35_HETBA